MPTGQEILGIAVAILALWFLLKMAKLAIKLVLFVIAILLVVGGVYFFLMR